MSGIIGIDPGKSGALALIGWNLRKPLLADTPTIMTGGKRQYDVAGMLAILRRFRHQGPLQAVLEQSQAMPKQGVTSTFSIGEGFGIWQGLLAGLEIPYTLVRPVQWKREMLSGIAVRDKGASVLRAKQLYPTSAQELSRIKDHNRAEAILLAAWGERTLNPTAR